MTLQSTTHTPPLIITMWNTLQESIDFYKSHYGMLEKVFSSSWKLVHMSNQGPGRSTTTIDLCSTGSQQHLAVKLQWCDDFRRNVELLLRASMALDLNIAEGPNNGTTDRLPVIL
ncbi:hypothetical protein FOPE_04151 [Fonsecaea pedrosoi]|nr:hypothetical protein FOPE_04151 [Fonsecaea pedrosoi]